MSQPAVPERAASRILDVALTDAPDRAREGVPPYATRVFVPAHPRPGRDGPPVVDFELLACAAGPPVPVAFTTLAGLVAALGDAQPWIAVTLGPYAEAMRDAGLPALRLDPAVRAEARTWRAQDLIDTYGGEEQD
ncbi:SAV_915 family protein [Streptomyces sp. NBC_01497]|uniref:SAV_915 family protein n=1 Tax=Streptomyces sp. NBC_01497 TaxID=2903885 RepID=UPI002E369EE2|nr:SAV_915 family protein [Streptomyces sp. NBC_01497]